MSSWARRLAPPPWWEEHFTERETAWRRHDSLAAIVVVLALFTAAARVHSQLSPLQIAVHNALVLLALLLLHHSLLAGRAAWRNAAVVALRLGLCASSLLRDHAHFVLEDSPQLGATALTSVRGVARMLLGDHTFLLAFLGVALPVGTLSNALVQLAGAALVTRSNRGLCKTPFMRGATAAAMRDPAPYVSALALHRLERYLRMPLLKMASHPTQEQICQWYTLALQAILGWAAPVLVWACADVRAAVQHAQRRGISPDDPLHRLFRRLHGLCSTQALLQVVLGLAAAALALAAAGLLYSGGAW